MRNLINLLNESLQKLDQSTPFNKTNAIALLQKFGYEDFVFDGNKIRVLVQIPDNQNKAQFRTAIVNNLTTLFQKEIPAYNPRYSNDRRLGSIGGIVFDNSPVAIVVKDSGKQKDNSAGMANEVEFGSILGSMVEKYKKTGINVTFVDPTGKKLTMNGVTVVDPTGKKTQNRQKADYVLRSPGGNLPISLKEITADQWESADSLFGTKAKQILANLQKQGALQMDQLQDDTGKVYYRLTKEIVVEPTEEESMAAIFGSDINPAGGVVIQTFEPQHFVQKDNNVTIECYAIIKNKIDIPESHLMVWLIRNDKSRNNPLPGLRTLGVTLTRGIGRRGNKPVILVDRHGKLLSTTGAAGVQKADDTTVVAPRARRSVGAENKRQRRA